ncbi:MAG: 2-oxo acid dehydrogenase subunit E2 [Oxalobacter sp.]|nr:MAG: 2-oxo acid dehydrogenase subunit E2 [Oxalobacter sp.]
MINFTLPSLGADMDKGKLVQWKVAPGDVVKRGQIVAVIETSKAAVEVEIWNDGIVNALLVEPGETVPVGTTLATLLAPGEAPGEKTGDVSRRTAPVSQTAPVTSKDEVKGEAKPSPAVLAPDGSAAPPSARRRVSPAARKHAEDAGIAIASLTGTGPDDAVTLEDVERAIANQKAQGQSKTNVTADEIVTRLATPTEPSSEMRKAIAAAMSRSKREIPHYYLSETVTMKKAQRWLAITNERRTITDRILMATLQLKAVALAVKQFPDMNGFYVDGAFKAGEGIHLGVAISLRQGGLIAPAIHDVADKTLDQIMRDLMDLVKRTRAGMLRSSELMNPTITVTNLGEQGVETVHGVIYPPQVALVGFGRVSERPWVENGGLFAMPVMTATLAADHRVSDGHRGGLFLAAIRDWLQRPEEL